MFKIGDKVKTLHDSEIAIVTNVFPDGKVEIEYEDFGMRDIYHLSELVPVSLKKNTPAPQPQTPSPPVKKTNFSEELLLKISSLKNDSLAYEIINNSDFMMNALVAKEQGKNIIAPLQSLTLKPGEQAPIINFPFSEYSDYKKILAYVIKFQSSPHHFIPAEIHRIKINLPKLSLKHSLEKGVVLPMKKDTPEQVLIKKQASTDKEKNLPEEIDLHAEKLFPPEELKRYSPDEIFALQLSRFKTFLEAHIIKGSEKCTIIHGLGKEVLKNEIHSTLHNNPFISCYEVISKGGATVIHFKK